MGIRVQNLSSVTFCAVAIACIAIAASGCGGPSATVRVDQASIQAEDALNDLDAAVRKAKASSRRSLVTMRATADEVQQRLDETLAAVVAIDASGTDARMVKSFAAALEAEARMARALSAVSLSPDKIEIAAAKARRIVNRAEGPALFVVDVTSLVDGLRRQKTKGKSSSNNGGSSSTPSAKWNYTAYSGDYFKTSIPSGGGWGDPTTSEPEPGSLYRTRVSGPGGLALIIDYTPSEEATFGLSYSSRTDVEQPQFGTVTKYVFTGGSLPECANSTCVDYIMNSGSTGPGFGVLAGGGTSAQAQEIAETAAMALIPLQGE